MKKLTLLIAALVLSFTAQAAIINGTPNPGDFGRLRYWVHTVANAGDTIVLADGTYEEKSVIDFTKAGLVVMAAEGANPVIQTVGKWMEMNVEAATTFEGIMFDAEAGTDGDNQYGFNISANTTFNNCKFQDYTKYAVTLLAGTTTFDNCVFDGAGVTPSAIVIDGTIAECSIENSEFKNYKDYNISVEDNTTIATLTIDQCVFDGANAESVKTTKAVLFTKGIVSTSNIQDSEFKNFAECVVTVEKWYGGRYDALTINNCLIHDCTQSAIYLPDAINENEKQTCSDFKLTNSTIYNVGAASTEDRGIVELRTNSNIASDQEVLIDHVTLYNFASSANAWSGGFYVGNSSNTIISNCIAMNPEDKKTLYANPYHAYTGAEITNSLYFNCDYNAGHGATTTDLLKADPMFVDAANADFMLYAESPAVGAGTDRSNLGDPRWGVKAGLKPGSEVLSKAVAAANDGDTIVLGDGEYIERWSYNYNKADLVVMAAEGAKPVIKANSYMKHYATTTFIGITFDGQNAAEYAIYSYENTEKDLTFINCELKNYTKYCITAGSSAHINKLLIDSCTIHDCGNAVYMPASGLENNVHTCSDFEMTNSTVYNIEGATNVGAIDIQANGGKDGNQNKVRIDHVTLYNFLTSGYEGGIKVYKSADAIISNCIVMNPAQKFANPYRLFTGAQIINSLYYNTEYANNGATYEAPIYADPLFVDAANGNFKLSANSPAVGAGTNGSNLGDTRWGVSASLKGKVINIEPGKQTLAAAVGYSVSPGDTIVLADGTYEEPYSFNFDVEGLVVMAAEGAKPEIILTDEGGNANLKLDNSTTFDRITFSGSNISKYLIITNGTDASKFIFNNCEFKNYLNYAISDPWTDKYENGRHVDSILINNCLFHDGGAAINLSKYGPEGKHTCDYFEMKNSTIYNISNTGNAAILVSSNAENTGLQNKVVLDHITIYNYANASYGAIAIRKSSDLQITNSIIANPTSGLYAFYIYGGTINNTLYYNATYDSDATYTACITDDPLFVDAANNNFKLKANSPAIGKATDGTNLGDPRWGVAEPEFITLNTGNNDAVIAANIGNTVNVKIERSFTANDGYYTLCVPFNMPASVIGKAYSLGTITKHVTGEGINIELKEENMLSAGMPYLVLPKANMSELVVENVTIADDDVAGQGVSSDELNVQIFFQGYYSASGQTNGSTEYYVGDKGYLYHEVVDIRGLCGLFTITDKEGNPTKVRARVVTREEVETGLDNNQLPNTNIQKAIENGQLIIIRDGVKYNVQGQVIK